MRKLAILFLKSTARGALLEALTAGDGSDAGAEPEVARPAGPLAGLLGAVGRFGGLLLPARAKVGIQEWLINRYRIPLEFQPREELERQMRRAFERLRDEAGQESPGDYLEFGVYQGASLICAHSALRAAGLEEVRLFGFDSFEGLPETSQDADVWLRGQFRSDYEFTVERLREAGVDLDRTRLVRGFFEDSLTAELCERESLRRAGVIMLDCDLYTSTVEALAFCRPLIRDVAYLFFDDWRSTDASHGQQRALREFREEYPELELEEGGSWHERSKIFLVREAGSAGDA